MSNAPIKRPAAGFCLPVELLKLRDADTLEVGLRDSSYRWAIRLIDCWAPEKYTEAGQRATAHAARLLAAADGLYLYLPLPSNPISLLKNLTFDRVLGYIYLDEHHTLNEELIKAGFATATKEQ